MRSLATYNTNDTLIKRAGEGLDRDMHKDEADTFTHVYVHPHTCTPGECHVIRKLEIGKILPKAKKSQGQLANLQNLGGWYRFCPQRKQCCPNPRSQTSSLYFFKINFCCLSLQFTLSYGCVTNSHNHLPSRSLRSPL